MGGEASVSVTEGELVYRFQMAEKWNEETCGMGGRGLKMSLPSTFSAATMCNGRGPLIFLLPESPIQVGVVQKE
jgi:hypothetical protein